MTIMRRWRLLPITAVGGLIIAAAGSAVGIPASAALAKVGVTIAARSPHYPGAVHGKVDGYAVVVFKDTSKELNTGVLSGHVTGAKGGVAVLLRERFGARKYTATGASARLSGSPARYTFEVAPSVETRYKVEVSVSGKVVATSVSATVWVAVTGVVSHQHRKCSPAGSPTSCTFSYQVREKVPVAAYVTETGKHFYLYQAVGYPALPKVFTLTKTAQVSKVSKVNSGEFKIVLTFHIPLRHHAGRWLTTFCTRDSESRDGLGIPGHHGCGNKAIKLTAVYVG
jgi:hypothetical protein